MGSCSRSTLASGPGRQDQPLDFVLDLAHLNIEFQIKPPLVPLWGGFPVKIVKTAIDISFPSGSPACSEAIH